MMITRTSNPRFFALTLTLALALNGPASAEQTLAEMAAAAFAAKDWKAATESYEGITRAEPENGAAWFRLGRSRHALGQTADAIAAYEKAESVGFNPQLSRFEMARSHAANGEAETALKLLGEVAELGPSRAIVARLEAAPELKSLDEAAMRKVQTSLTPCSSPEYRQFDFWLGDWAVESPATGAALGTNRITSHLGGCMLLETWTSASPHEGMSINYYDSRDGSWNQIFIDNTGNVGTWPPLRGALKDGEMVLASPTDATPRTRWTWTDLGNGKVRQRAESSTDGGETWTTGWDSIYVLQKDRAQPD
ncbi:MAG: tetratricopeptide repeat protein [bacterium]|nr:tetratricopeptide repeat protein [bacterium]